jgi:hypothetical protein
MALTRSAAAGSFILSRKATKLSGWSPPSAAIGGWWLEVASGARVV